MLEKLKQEFIISIIQKARRYFLAHRVLDYAMIVFGCWISVAQFTELKTEDGIDVIKLGAIIFSILLAAAAGWRLLTEHDPSKDLKSIQSILQEAAVLEEERTTLRVNVSKVVQSSFLSQSYFAMRGAIEQLASQTELEVEECLERMLKVAMKQLEAAAAFDPGKHWTFCIYKTVQGNDGLKLVLVADLRAVPCERQNARSWPIGIGPAGVALAKQEDEIVPDLADSASQERYGLPNGMRRPKDMECYRAIAAIPVNVGSGSVPWGVVVGSMSEPGHFVKARFKPSSIPTDTVRAIAEMSALLIAMRK